jgi:hypothetical protein
MNIYICIKLSGAEAQLYELELLNKMEIVIYMAGRITAKAKIPASIENRLRGLEGQSGSSGDIKNTSVVLLLTLTSERYPCYRRDLNQQSQQPSGRRLTP